MKFFNIKSVIANRAVDALYVATGLFKVALGAPRKLARRFVGEYSQKKVSDELQRFVNLYMVSALLQRILILSLIIIFYIIAKELRLNTNFYIAIITILIALYSAIIVVIGLFMYIDFCIERRIPLNPWKVAYHYTALEIKRAIEGNNLLTRVILRIAVGDTEEFAHEVAYSAIYSREIKMLIYMRALYYGFIFGTYIIGYRFIYERLIDIDFTNFIHPFTWAWFYLVSASQ